MTSYNAHKLFSEIESVVKSDLSVADGFQRVIQYCERERPHADWATLRSLDVEGDLSHLREWLRAIMRTTPPPAAVSGLWFGLFNASIQGKTTADVHVIGAPYSAEDPDWIFGERWGQDTPDAESTVLDAIYQIACGGLGRPRRPWRGLPRGAGRAGVGRLRGAQAGAAAAGPSRLPSDEEGCHGRPRLEPSTVARPPSSRTAFGVWGTRASAVLVEMHGLKEGGAHPPASAPRRGLGLRS